MTHDASHSYTYDAENRITQVDGGSTATYTYGADGRRFSKTAGGVETDFFYDLSGHVVADYGGGSGITTWHTGHVYVNGQVLAGYFGPTYFYVTEHLGSTRLLTNYNGPSVVECDDYYPFGEQISCGGTSTTTHKFTGYERDTESGLDNAQARYNSSSLGRFMSPDPIGNFVADATNPQTWNLYTYVNNNPLNFVDPTGMYCETSDEFDLSGINDADVCVVFGGVWIDDGPPNQCQPPTCATQTSCPPGQSCTNVTTVLVSGGGGCNPSTDLLCGQQYQTMLNYYQQRGVLIEAAYSPYSGLQTLNLAGLEANHYMGCVGKAIVGIVPFAGHLVGGAKTSLDGPNSVLGLAGEAQIVASQSSKISKGLDYIEMPNIGEAVGQYAPYAGEFLGKFGPGGAVVSGVNAGLQANACFDQHP